MALHLLQLKKRYIGPDGSVVPVIDIPEFHIADGEQIALVGSSGSGKTTLLHLIAGILPADSGEILFEAGALALSAASAATEDRTDRMQAKSSIPPVSMNLSLLSEPERDRFRGRYVGYVFQTHHLLPGFTALENVQLGMSFAGRSANSSWARHLLAEVGLSDRLDYKPAKLSVGQQQRVAVARALANRPRLVLADEPTGALDTVNAQQVLDLIRKLCDEVNASLMLVTHDRAIAEQLPRVVSLKELNRAAT